MCIISAHAHFIDYGFWKIGRDKHPFLPSLLHPVAFLGWFICRALMEIIAITSKSTEPFILLKTLLPFEEIGKWPLMGVTQDQRTWENVYTQLNIGTVTGK